MLSIVALAGLFGSAAPETSCTALKHSMPAGAVARADDFIDTNCPDRVEPAFHYDAEVGAARATRPLSSGDVVRAVPAHALATVRPGDRLYVAADVGVVRIVREVVALQPGRPGRKLFVRASSGEVFAVTLSEAQR